MPRLQGGGNRDGMPLDILIKVSNDGMNWETVLERKDIPHPSGKTRGFAFDAKSARYVMVEGIRLRAMPSDGNQYRMQIQGLEIYGP